MKRKSADKDWGIDLQVERIETGVTRCDNIITQLLDFSRSKRLDCRQGDLDGWLEKVIVEEAQKLDPAISLTCELGLDGQLVAFDGARLQRAVINLLSNAAEALIGGTVKTQSPSIHVSTALVDDMFVIAVRDNGPGMNAEVLAKVREPLFTTKSFGTGLGIPAIEQIAVQHGGTLDIQSEQGKGALFTITLPNGSDALKAA